MFFHESNGIVLHARWLGDPHKPLIVFANSLGTDQRIWDAVVPLLSDTYSMLLYDKRGHGLSEMPQGPVSIADHAADLLGLVDRIGAERFALVGLSVGGLIAQAIAADHPHRVAGLVLCDTAAKIGDAESWNARIEAVNERGLAAIGDSILERWFTHDYRERERVALRGWSAMLTRQPPGGYTATCAAIREADLREAAAGIGVPTLVLVGEQDLTTPPALVEATAHLIPGARFAVIPEAAHLPCIEQPAHLAQLIAEHLAEVAF